MSHSQIKPPSSVAVARTSPVTRISNNKNVYNASFSQNKNTASNNYLKSMYLKLVLTVVYYGWKSSLTKVSGSTNNSL